MARSSEKSSFTIPSNRATGGQVSGINHTVSSQDPSRHMTASLSKVSIHKKMLRDPASVILEYKEDQLRRILQVHGHQ